MATDRQQALNVATHPCQLAMTRRGFLGMSGGALAAGVLFAQHCAPTAHAQTGMAAGAVATSHWPLYGHDSAHTGQSPFSGPVSPKVAWSFPLGGAVRDNASPVVGLDGVIYMPSANTL